MPMVVHPDHKDEFAEQFISNTHGDGGELAPLEIAQHDYVQMIDNGVPKYEARQILPNASAVNILWTVNARSLLNFFELRLCKRNVDEMQIFAGKIWESVNSHWPEFASLCGPYCYPSGKCNQGFMSCGQPYKREQSEEI